MASIDTSTPTRNKRGVPRVKRHSLKTDMTPMVDLGFLLITFFVMTVQLTKPFAMDLTMPKDGMDMPVAESDALTVLLGSNNTIYYYAGSMYDAIQAGSIKSTGYSGKGGLRDVIIKQQQRLDITRARAEGRNGLILIIKPTADASYKNVVDILDEVTINAVKKYVVVKPSPAETVWIAKSHL